MNRLKKMYSIIAVTVFALGMIVVPAQAASGPAAVGVCSGTATVKPSIGLPVLDDKSFTWDITVDCTVVSVDGVETLRLVADGEAFGACGLSTAEDGTGTLTNLTNPSQPDITLENIGWTSVGSMLFVDGTHDAPDSNLGQFQAQVNAQGGTACLEPESDEHTFIVNIVSEFV